MSVLHEPSKALAAGRKFDPGLLVLIGGAAVLIVAGLVAMLLVSRRAPELAPASSPEGVTQRFYQAAYQGDYDTARQFLSADVQRSVSASELQSRMSDQLRQSQMHVGAAIMHGASATVPVTQTHFSQDGLFGPHEWSSDSEVQLVREGEAWKISNGGFYFW
jgi:hypothetical protein